MRGLIISLPLGVIALVLLAFFCLESSLVRRVILRRCNGELREEFAEQATNLVTGVSATFAFFVGFAISISWGAISAGQNAVEQQAAAIHQMAWEVRNIPDRAVSSALMDKLRNYTTTAADQDDDFLARGITVGLPSAGPLDEFENAVRAYAYGPGADSKATGTLVPAVSSVVSASTAVSAVANRALPRPLAALLFVVATLVTGVMGMTTVKLSRRSMVFVYVWCLIPALSLTVVLALAYPFALRTGLTLAPMRAVAQQLAAP